MAWINDLAVSSMRGPNEMRYDQQHLIAIEWKAITAHG